MSGRIGAFPELLVTIKRRDLKFGVGEVMQATSYAQAMITQPTSPSAVKGIEKTTEYAQGVITTPQATQSRAPLAERTLTLPTALESSSLALEDIEETTDYVQGALQEQHGGRQLLLEEMPIRPGSRCGYYYIMPEKENVTPPRKSNLPRTISLTFQEILEVNKALGLEDEKNKSTSI